MTIQRALSWRLAVVALAVSIAAGLAGWATASNRAVSAASSGGARYKTVATVADSGSGDIVFEPTTEEEVRREVPLTLPAGARQAGEHWYLLRFHYRVELDPGSGRGEVHVVASINNGASALQAFETIPTAAGLRVTTRELSLISGARVNTSRKLVYGETFRNWAQDAAIRPGPGAFTFKVKQFGQARIRRVTVYVDTAVERTRTGPPSLAINVLAPTGKIHVGEQLTISYRVRNNGSGPSGPGHVRISFPTERPGLKVVGPSERRLPSVPAHATRSDTFRVVGKRVGITQVDLDAYTAVADATASYGITVRPR